MNLPATLSSILGKPRHPRGLKVLFILATLIMSSISVCRAAPDSLPKQTPSVPRGEPVLRLEAKGVFDKTSVRTGDTVTYRLRISWNDIPAGVMLLPREELRIEGLRPAGSDVVQTKVVSETTVTNQTDFTHIFIALAPGTARVLPHTVRYRNGLTGRDEEVGVPGVSLTITAVPDFLWGRPGGNAIWIAALLSLLLVVLLAGWILKRRRPHKLVAVANSDPASHTKDSVTRSALATLRDRYDSADGRVWLTDAERLCIEWLCHQLAIAHPAHVRFEAALDQYLDRHPGLSPAVRASWTTLRDQFHEARYAGVGLEPHQRIELCRHLKICLLPVGHQGDQPT